MSKSLLVFLILACAVVNDPPHALEWIKPQVQTVGGKLSAALDIKGLLPQLSQIVRR
jgi:hypothetical protein